MKSVRKTKFCAICGRNHDPEFPCASVSGVDALEKTDPKKSKENGAGPSFQKLSHKTDKIMILIAILLGLLIVVRIYIKK